MESWKRTVELPCVAASASAARDFVSALLVEHGHSTLVADARLVVSELSTNSIVHAEGPFRVTLDVDSRQLLVSVSDGSPRWPVPRIPAVSASTGRGLRIVERLSAAWGVDLNAEGVGKTVWARLLLH